MTTIIDPLTAELQDEIYRARRGLLGDDLSRPRTYIIGRLNADGSTETTVRVGNYGLVWVRIPGNDTGDAVQAINLSLDKKFISFNRPVSVKKRAGKLFIEGLALESADYDADDAEPRPQVAINRSQYDVALLRPTTPESMVCLLTGGVYQVQRQLYRIKPQQTQNFTSLIPGSNAIAYRVEIDPLTGILYYLASGSFSVKSIEQAFDDGDLNTTISTNNRTILGYIRLFAGQEIIIREDILPTEYFLNGLRQYGFPNPVIEPITIQAGIEVDVHGDLNVQSYLNVQGKLHVLPDPAVLPGYNRQAEIDHTDSPYTPDDEDSVFVVTDSGNVDVYLPDINVAIGRVFTFKHRGTGILTLYPTSGQKIDGASLLISNQKYDAIKVEANSIEWSIM